MGRIHNGRTANIHYSDELSKFVASQPWDYFVTFTTKYELTLPSCRRLMERFHNRIGQESLTKNRLFWVAEHFEAKDGYHAHGLLATEVPFDSLRKIYQIVSGARKKKETFRIHLAKYDPALGAAKYCSKYILKRCSDYDFL